MIESVGGRVARAARMWWLIVSASWVLVFVLLLDWSPGGDLILTRPIEQIGVSPASGKLPTELEMPFVGGGAPTADARTAEVRAQAAGNAWLARHPPDCWGTPYSAPNADGTRMEWHCATRGSLARMIATNGGVLASLPLLLSIVIGGGLRMGRRFTEPQE